MADDITQSYKTAISKAAGNIYTTLTKADYLKIDTSTKQYFLHVKEVTQKRSESGTIYDINVTGSGIMFNLDDRGKVVGATVSDSISPEGLLMGATVSPDDDPVVMQIDQSTYDSAVTQLATLASGM